MKFCVLSLVRTYRKEKEHTVTPLGSEWSFSCERCGAMCLDLKKVATSKDGWLCLVLFGRPPCPLLPCFKSTFSRRNVTTLLSVTYVFVTELKGSFINKKKMTVSVSSVSVSARRMLKCQISIFVINPAILIYCTHPQTVCQTQESSLTNTTNNFESYIGNVFTPKPFPPLKIALWRLGRLGWAGILSICPCLLPR